MTPATVVDVRRTPQAVDFGGGNVMCSHDRLEYELDCGHVCVFLPGDPLPGETAECPQCDRALARQSFALVADHNGLTRGRGR